MISSSPKSWGAVEGGNNNICFARAEIEEFKNVCDADLARANRTEKALEEALKQSTDLKFYQEDGFVIGHAILTGVLIILFGAGR